MQRCKCQIFVPRLQPRFDVNNDGHTLYFQVERPSDYIPRVSGAVEEDRRGDVSPMKNGGTYILVTPTRRHSER